MPRATTSRILTRDHIHELHRASRQARQVSPLDALQRWLPKLVTAPSMLIVLVGFYAYIGWTFLLSFTNSRFMPSYKWVGLQQYQRLWDNDRWWVASQNLLVFGGLFIAISLIIGVVLAVLLDQRIRREGLIRTIYLYPMALSMIVTGTAGNGCSIPAWVWTSCCVTGAGKAFASTGWSIGPGHLLPGDRCRMAGLGLRHGAVPGRSAQRRSIDHPRCPVDGASLPTIYLRIVLPSLRPVFFSALMILAHIAIKSFDTVAAMTAGGRVIPATCRRCSCTPTPSPAARWAWVRRAPC